VTGTLVPGTSSAVVALDGLDLMLRDLTTGEPKDRFSPAPEDLLTFSGLRLSGDGRFFAQPIDVSTESLTNMFSVTRWPRAAQRSDR
jgi:hypothetical protein